MASKIRNPTDSEQLPTTAAATRRRREGEEEEEEEEEEEQLASDSPDTMSEIR